MSLIKDYAATICETDDGIADMEAIEQMEFERAYKQYELNKLQEELK